MGRRMASDGHRGSGTGPKIVAALSSVPLDMEMELIITTFFCSCVRNRTEAMLPGNGPLDRNNPFRHWPAHSR